MAKWRGVTCAGITAAIIATLLALGYGYYRHVYPYGRSHSCDKQLMFALQQYADDHGGLYPAGEATPEASLSLLYPDYASAELLCGKTGPVEVVREILGRGERLSPETCGWHYVDGLTLHEQHRFALLWDKAGLGHFGERRSDGGRTVLFVNLGYEYILGPDWPKFLEEQQAWWEERARMKRRSARDDSR